MESTKFCEPHRVLAAFFPRPTSLNPPPLPSPLSTHKAVAAFATAAGLGAFLAATRGRAVAAQYATCYVLEQALSFDNLAVFVLIFRQFCVSPPAQERVLTVGLASAAVLRLAMVAAGAEMIAHARPVLLAFAGLLVWSALKLSGLAGGGEDDDEEKDLAHHPVVRAFRRFIPLSDSFDGDRFFTPDPARPGRWVATPLLLVLAVVEVSDIVFAVDSVPALFGVTADPVVVWAATMAAVASLRSVYAAVAASLAGLRFLDRAVAVVLAVVGAKMIVEFCGGPAAPTALSLAVVVGALGAGVAASLVWPEPADGKGSGGGGGGRAGGPAGAAVDDGGEGGGGGGGGGSAVAVEGAAKRRV